MITLVKLKNFKAFEKESFQFKPLTLLSGLNNTGKSSLLQSLLLLRQSYQQKLLPDVGLALNGDLVSIGTAQDALFADAKENSIGFEVLWKDGTQGKWDFNYSSETDVLGLASQPNTSTIYESSLFSDRFHYLQAERIGPRTYLEISDFQVRQHQQLGTQGEYTAHFLSIYGRKDIPNSNLKHPEEEDLNLKLQVEAWIGEVSPGTRIEINSNPTLDRVSLQYSSGLSNPYRATNIGFGINYTLPIIVAILASEPGTVILIEHPEAHLHPKGQVKMGELLSLAASSGVQVVVETHSDHVLNGIRLAVHGGKLAPQDVQCHFLSRTKQGMTEVISPHIDRNGRIDQWPDGFFNEWENSLYALL